jgi:uncharacterized membrane protein
MSDLDFVRLFKTLHVLSVALLAGGITVETLIGPMLARATSTQELKTLTRLSRVTELFVVLPAAVLIPAFGYATAGKDNIDLGRTWILIAQVLFFIAAAISIAYLARASLRLEARVRGLPDGPIPEEVAKDLKNPLPAILGALLTVVFIFIVYLMVAQPNW